MARTTKKAAEALENKAVVENAVEMVDTSAEETKKTPAKKTAAKKPAATKKAPAKKKAEPVVEEAKPVVVESTPVVEKDASGEKEVVAEKAAKPKTTRKRVTKPVENKPEVLSISGEKSVLTEEEQLRENILDLVASKKTGKVLSGVITGIEQHGTMKVAVVYHGELKVIIPAEYLIPASSVPKTSKDYAAAISHSTIKRLGAEIDYVVEDFDHVNNVAIGNRLKAMEAKRKHYYFAFDRQGNKLLYPDAFCEARVVSVVRSGVFVEVFGIETFVRLKELSYQRINNTEDEFKTGMTVLVKILALDTSDKDNIKVSVSVKQAKENPAAKALSKISEGSYYMGKVTMVDIYGVFVSLDCGIDCLCKHPFHGRPIRGARTSVKIIGIDREDGRVWGVISDMGSVM